MKSSMTGQDKGDPLIQVTTWVGLTIHFIFTLGSFVKPLSYVNQVVLC
jgi:hypothetical protein